MINLNGKKFRAKKNSENGEICGATIFHYFQDGEKIWGEYFGGKIEFGILAGRAKNGAIEFNYWHFCEKKFRAGCCVSTPEILANGKICLHEKWQWTAGEKGGGESIIEEI